MIVDSIKPKGSSAVIFDMDGVVINTAPGFYQAWKSAAKKIGYDISDLLVKRCIGLNHLQIKKILLAELGDNFPLVDFFELSSVQWYEFVESKGVPVMPGFFTFLKQLRRYNIPHALATNSRRHYTNDCLRFAGLDDVFQHIVTLDEVTLGKPAPEIFLKAAKLLGQPIENCLIIEDSYTGIQAALNSQARTLLVNLEYEKIRMQLTENIIDHCFHSLEELSRMLRIVSKSNHINFNDQLVYLFEG